VPTDHLLAWLQVKEAEPGIAFTDIGRRIAELWKECTPEDKVPFEDLAKNDKVRRRSHCSALQRICRAALPQHLPGCGGYCKARQRNLPFVAVAVTVSFTVRSRCCARLYAYALSLRPSRLRWCLLVLLLSSGCALQVRYEKANAEYKAKLASEAEGVEAAADEDDDE
jgi:hypothetical protein